LKKKKKLCEGKSRKIYVLEDAEQLIQEFKDDAPVFESGENVVIKGKGIINKDISAYLFGYLEGFHIPTHFIKDLGGREMLTRRLDMIPVEVVMRNIAAGTLCERYGLEPGKELPTPIVEFYLKDKNRHRPMINQTHAVAFQLATPDEVRMIERMTLKINAILKSFFSRRKYKLIDFKVEFGRLKNKIVLGDEVSLNTCRLWDVSGATEETANQISFDFHIDEASYEEIKNRLFGS